MKLFTALEPQPSPARTRAPERTTLRVGAVQHRWHADPDEHELTEAARIAAAHGSEPISVG
jgi:N-carbamoylputrescine amidase